MMLDPAAEADEKKITLRVTNLTMQEALRQILEQAGPESSFIDEGLFVYKKGAYKTEAPLLKPLSEEQIKAFHKALKDFENDDFSVREAASKTIEAWGADAAPHIQTALKGAKDAEVKARLTKLHDKATIRPLFKEDLAVEKALEPLSRAVTFEFCETPASDAMAFLNSLLKVEIRIDEKLKQKPLTLRVSNMSAACALKWIARLSGGKLEAKDKQLQIVPDKKPASKSETK